MANALNRDLKKGDKVVLRGGVEATCGGECFGSMSFLSGTALDVCINGKAVRANGYDIDVAATNERFAKENGWVKEEAK